jgi:hypothetical protein
METTTMAETGPIGIRCVFALVLLPAALVCSIQNARAIDFYEIQAYPTETVAPGHAQVELHSNSVTGASGEAAHAALRPYEVHETLETTYGLFEHAKIGQCFATTHYSAPVLVFSPCPPALKRRAGEGREGLRRAGGGRAAAI